ncbi:PorT family protein [Flavobacterium salilacus subsp. salilacus]|uniref:porin family protein n=2 Tax=Flavobacterium TaxID=237 RepID=UPI001074EFC1|nr:porin family protein [Flavobacterium salilacus]KAF2520137.1 PorT family protein [Flavobacterium salilacus subsp. salilacus]
MRSLFIFMLGFVISTSFAQNIDEVAEEKTDSITVKPDPLYREDQFYASISYVLMQNKPDGYDQNSVSTGLTMGFLRDMPINEKRTYAIAVGLGYAYYNIKHDLKVTESAGAVFYEQEDAADFDKNKQVLHYLELPIELRWRNSDDVSHKFWRVYTGFKISYLFADKAQYYPLSGGSTKVKSNGDLNSIVYGAYISAGWNTWNLYAYYGITPLYKQEARLNDDGQKINLNTVSLGLIFYIL